MERLSIKLSSTLTTSNENFVMSPASLAVLLGMVYAGAAGSTANSIEALLFDTSVQQEEVHGCASLVAASLASAQAGKGVELHSAGALWLQQDVLVKKHFLDILSMYYDTGVRSLDFRSRADSVADALNRWASEQTKGRIPTVAKAESLTRNIQLLSTQAVCMSAPWSSEFPSRATAPAAFHRLDGSTIQVPTMHHTLAIPYVEMADVKVVALPYRGNEWSMLVVLPDAPRFNEVRRTISPARLQELRSSLSVRATAVALPKFKIEAEIGSLRQGLERLGARDVFSEHADFSQLSAGQLRLSDMSQQVVIEVDELGTQAAVVTGAQTLVVAGMPPTTAFAADHPFLFYVMDQHGLVLFAGQVSDPSWHAPTRQPAIATP